MPELTQQEIEEFARELVRLVGPMAVVVAKQEADRPGFIETYCHEGLPAAMEAWKHLNRQEND